MDSIRIHKLKVFAYHGCDIAENKNGQYFYITADIFLDLTSVGITDKLEDTLNYALICTQLKEWFILNKYNTLERVATFLLDSLLERYSLIESASITIDKPNAPIGLEFDNISVTITKQRNIVFLGLGSNIGDRQAYIDKAISEISHIAKVEKVAKSIVTKPWGNTAQADFINTVIQINTTMISTQLLQAIKKIERDMGRKKSKKWSERIIDIDILFYNNDIVFKDVIIDSIKDKLVIPHPYLHKRAFVLLPLVELASELVHPIYSKTVQELLDCLE